MKTDWKILGQVGALMLDIQIFCRDHVRGIEAKPQMLEWLMSGIGKKALSSVLNYLVAQWKMSFKRNDEMGPVPTLTQAKRMHYWEGWSSDVSDENFPSGTPINRYGVYVEFCFPHEINVGSERFLLKEQGLAPAESRGFVQWLGANPTAGVDYSIHCVSVSYNGGYMCACLCGGGGRGMHTYKPFGGVWPAASVFICTELL